MLRRCWKCGEVLEDLPEKVPFRATCERCGAWIHACVSCCHYQPGLPNDCKVPGTEFVADREGSNFCEEFHFFEKGKETLPNRDFSSSKKRFDFLFED